MAYIEFPDAELQMIEALRPRMPGVYLDRRVPDEARPKMVILRWQGGAAEMTSRFWDSVRLGVNTYADNPKAAGDLAREARAHMHDLADEGVVKNMQTTGLSEPKDNTHDMSRRYFIAMYQARGTQI